MIAYGLEAVRNQHACADLEGARDDLQQFVQHVRYVRRFRTLQTPIEEIAPASEVQAADEERQDETGNVPGTAVG